MYKKLFIEKTDNLFIQFFRYLFVGGFAFAVDFTVLFLLTDKLKIFYLVSATISFTLGLLVNYFLSKIWVFNSQQVKNKWAEFLIFAAIGLVGLGLNVSVIWLLTEKVKLFYLVSKILATGVVYGWNFGARKVILFK